MKMLQKLLLLIAAIAVVCVQANAQSEKRIQFPKGKSSTVIKGHTGTAGAAYVLRVRSGQKIVLDLTPAKGIGIKLETNGRYGHMVLLREEQGGHYEIGLEESGDHTILVGSTSGRSVPFTLRVSVTKMSDI